MSWEATYNPLDVAVPNVVTGWNNVDLSTKNPNTISNPDITLVGKSYDSIQPVGNCTVVGNALVPFTAQQAQAWAAELAAILLAQQRATAQALVVSTDPTGKVVRATIDQLLILINGLATTITQLQSTIVQAPTFQAAQAALAIVTVKITPNLQTMEQNIITEIASGGEGD